MENDCSVFYPAVEDGSGKFGAPFLIYEKDQVKGLNLVVKDRPRVIRMVARLILKSLLSV